MGATIRLGFATVMTAISLLLVALAFSTDHWLDYTVDRQSIRAAGGVTEQELSDNELYFTRNRGLFRTCYPGNETICKLKEKSWKSITNFLMAMY